MKKTILGRRGIAFMLAGILSLSPLTLCEAYAETTYEQGSYTGEAVDGFKGDPVTVTLTLGENDGKTVITDAAAEREFLYSTEGSKRVWKKALAILDTIKEKNSVEGIDAVSGATYSSKAILEAAGNALSKAERKTVFDGGEGTKEQPYLIADQESLLAFAQSVGQTEIVSGNEMRKDYAGKYIRLTADINLTGAEWTPVGTKAVPFAGNFDGDDHVIKGLRIGNSENPADSQYAGFFGYASGTAVLENICLTEAEVYLNVKNSKNVSAGILLGSGDSVYNEEYDAVGGTKLKHCYVSGVLDVKTQDKKANVGGLAGLLNQYSIVADCGSDVEVKVNTGTYTANAGGLVGTASGSDLFINDYAMGDVMVTTTDQWSTVGGLTGSMMGFAYNVYASGSVSGNGVSEEGTVNGMDVGGLFGDTMKTYLAQAYYRKASEGISEISVNGEFTTGKDTETIQALSKQEMQTEEFAERMSGSISEKQVTGFWEKLEAYNETLSGKKKLSYEKVKAEAGTQFYGWIYDEESGKVIHSEEYYVPKKIDPSIFAGGNGTKEFPYQIQTAEQLVNFAASINPHIDYAGCFITLENDIDLKDAEWKTAGAGENAFCGSFDGKGHKILGLNIGTKEKPFTDNAQMNYGMFGILGDGAVVRNLTIDAAIYVSSEATVYVGAVAGANNRGWIDQVTVNGEITVESDGVDGSYANNFVGGVAGVMRTGSKVTNAAGHADCRAATTGGIGECGGIVGMLNRGLVANCFADGRISGNADRGLEGVPALGGVAGLQAGTLINCYADSDVIAECFSQYIGALAGWATGIAETFQCYYSEDAYVEMTKNTSKDEKVRQNPVAGIGWAVGPGVSDEGEAYTGSFTLEVEGLSAEEFTASGLAKRLNGNIEKFDADLLNGNGTWSGNEELAGGLRQWTTVEDKAAPAGDKTQITYAKDTVENARAEVLKKAKGTLPEGVFYGRDAAKNSIVKIEVDSKGRIRSAELISKEASEQEKAELQKLVSEGVTDGMTEGALKEACDTAVQKSRNGDNTGYGKANASIFDGGKGTKEDPWRIATEEQLVAFAASVNEDEHYEDENEADRYVVLTKDITLTKEWIPAGGQGSVPHAFAGSFDGQKHVIKGLRIGSAGAPANIRYGGLFSYLSGADIKNVYFEDVSITAEDTATKRMYVGILTGVAAGVDYNTHIDRVFVDGSIVLHGNSDPIYVGGVTGQMAGGTITNTESNVRIDAISDASWVYAGGLAGIPSFALLANNTTHGSIQAKASVNMASLGGIAGFNACTTINCVAAMELISANTTTDLGGLAGRNTGVGFMADSYYDVSKEQRHGNVTLSAQEKNAYGMTANEAVSGLEPYTKENAEEVLNRMNPNNLSDANEKYAEAKVWYTEKEDCLIPENLSFDALKLSGTEFTFDRLTEAQKLREEENQAKAEEQRKAEEAKKAAQEKKTVQTAQPAAVGTVIVTENGRFLVTDASKTAPKVSFAGMSGNGKKMSIPSSVTKDGITYTVTKIADKALKGKKKLKKVSLPATLTEIGRNAFAECTALKNITIPKNVTKIGAGAFRGDSSLRKIVIKSAKLESVGKNALKGIHPKAVVRVPKKQKQAYGKLFQKRGQKAGVKIQ